MSTSRTERHWIAASVLATERMNMRSLVSYLGATFLLGCGATPPSTLGGAGMGVVLGNGGAINGAANSGGTGNAATGTSGGSGIVASGGAPSAGGSGVTPGGAGAAGTAGSSSLPGGAGAPPNLAGAGGVGTNGGGAGTASGGASAVGGSGDEGGQGNVGGNDSGGSGAGGANASGDVVRSTGCGVMDHPESGDFTIDVGGTQREYTLKLPDDYDPSVAYKLIFGWHWRGGQASDVTSGQIIGGPYYGLEELAAGTAIFVSPNGIDNGWANTGGRDIQFLEAMLEDFTSSLCIDENRLFSTGFSYGGMMSDAIGCDLPGVFRALAPMSGALYSGCNRDTVAPVAFWMAHGVNDDVVPLEDGLEALAVYLEVNGCGDETVPIEPSPCVEYQGCTEPVVYCEFDGGHSPQGFAPEASWEFFSRF